jgi:hypothetical protein
MDPSRRRSDAEAHGPAEPAASDPARGESARAAPTGSGETDGGREGLAGEWLAWSRTEGHDAYWEFRDLFFELVPLPRSSSVARISSPASAPTRSSAAACA